MTKQDLDKCFIQIYSSLKEYSIKAIKFFKSQIELEHLLSETYIYVESRKEIISDIFVLESFCKYFIKTSIKWKNSQINRANRKNIPLTGLEIVDYKFYIHNAPDYEIYLGIKDDFYKQLNNYDRRLFNIYFNLEMKSGKEIARYLNISLSLSYRTIKECKDIENRFKIYILSKYIF